MALPDVSADGLNRRLFIVGAGCAASGAVFPRPASARPRDVEYALRQLVGTAPITPGRVLLDIPSHSDTGTSVPITVGIERATSERDIPRTMHVLADGNPRPHILSAWFSAESVRPEIATRIRLESAQTVTAVAAMPDGSIWRADRALTVNFGACAEVGSGTPAEIRDFKPVPRVSVPKTAHIGDVVNIRTLISHPMETGLRLDSFNNWIPMRIIEEFSCSFEGGPVLRIRPYPAISTNPYFSFFARVRSSGTFEFRWLDTNGSVYTSSAAIEVSDKP